VEQEVEEEAMEELTGEVHQTLILGPEIGSVPTHHAVITISPGGRPATAAA